MLNVETISSRRTQHHIIKEVAYIGPYMHTTLHQTNALHQAATPLKQIYKNTILTKHTAKVPLFSPKT